VSAAFFFLAHLYGEVLAWGSQTTNQRCICL